MTEMNQSRQVACRKDDRTFGDIVDAATRNIHSALLEGGGKRMREQVWIELNTVLHWRNLQLEKEEEFKARRK